MHLYSVFVAVDVSGQFWVIYPTLYRMAGAKDKVLESDHQYSDDV